MTSQPAKPAEKLWPSGSKPTPKGVRTLVEGVRTNHHALRYCKHCGCSLDAKRTDAEYCDASCRRAGARERLNRWLRDRIGADWQSQFEAWENLQKAAR